MSAWITLSVLALLPMLVRTPKALARLRVDPDDPSRFAGAFSGYKIGAFTGYASDINKRGDSYTSGEIKSNLDTDRQLSKVYGSINTKVVIVDQFFLTSHEGQTQSFQLTDLDAAIGNGNHVSVAWVLRKRAKSGPCFLVYNHTTQRTFFHDKTVRSITFPYPTFYVTILILMILPLPLVVCFGAMAMRQDKRFMQSGVKPLLSSLDSGTTKLPRPTESSAQLAPLPAGAVGMASELREIATLRDSGALTDEEFEAAKAKLLTS